MEWEHFGSNGGKLGSLVCSDEKVEELVIFMLSNGLMPFKLAPEENMIIRLDTSNHGKDWKFDKKSIHISKYYIMSVTLNIEKEISLLKDANDFLYNYT